MRRRTMLAAGVLTPGAIGGRRGLAGGLPGPRRSLRVAGAHVAVSADVDANVAALGRAIDWARAARADVLVTPEGALSGYVHGFSAAAVRAALDVVVGRARAAGVALALGTCFEEADGQRYNQVRLYDRGGRFLGFHAKVLLCRRVAEPERRGEIDHFATRPLRTFDLGGVRVGALVCNDLWANPEWTPQDDPHLLQQLAALGAQVVFHSVNSGTGEGEELELNRRYHETNLRLRARSARRWVVIADAADPAGRRNSHAPSGVVDPSGRFVVRIDDPAERCFVHDLELA